MTPLILVALVAPVVAYLAVGFSPRSRAKTDAEYFVYAQQVDVRDYANTSVGYALQMAAVFLFAYWALLYGLGALWAVLFWFVGFFFLKRLLPKFMAFHATSTTMHQYIAGVFGGGRRLRILAAFATIVGLWGTMMAEVGYTIQILEPIFPNRWSQLGIGAAFVVFGTLYILVNGYKAEVNTERFQVPVAYAAFFLVLISCLPAVWQHAGDPTFFVVGALLVFCLGSIVFARQRYAVRLHLDDWIPILALISTVVVVFCIVTHGPGGASRTIVQSPLFTTQLRAQGIVGVVSLLIANALWMPVDFATWQRIASVKGENPREIQTALDHGTWRVMFESPATWILGIVLGLEIQGGGFLSVGADPSTGLTSFVTSLAKTTATGPWWSPGTWIYPLFIIACISIMMSTVHGLISAIAFTADRDLLSKRPTTAQNSAIGVDQSVSPHLQRLRTAKWVTGGIILSAAIYPGLLWLAKDQLPTLLYGAYSMQLSLIVVVLLALTRRNIRPWAGVVSILSGFAGTALSVWAAISITNPNAQVLPPIFAVLGSLIGYVLAYKWRAGTPEPGGSQ